LDFDSGEDNPGFAVELEYHDSVSTENSTLLSQNGFRFQVNRLIEFNESGDTEGFQPDEDMVTMNFTLGEWNTWSVVTEDSFTMLSINTTDDVVGVEIYFTPTNYSFNGLLITANKMKINMNVYDFPYTTTGSQLAISGKISSLETNSTQTASVDGSTVTWESSSSIISGRIKWIDEAATESETIDVIVSVQDDLRFLVTFDTDSQPELIKWDPVLGYIMQTDDSGDPTGSSDTIPDDHGSNESSFMTLSMYPAVFLLSVMIVFLTRI